MAEVENKTPFTFEFGKPRKHKLRVLYERKPTGKFRVLYDKAF